MDIVIHWTYLFPIIAGLVGIYGFLSYVLFWILENKARLKRDSMTDHKCARWQSFTGYCFCKQLIKMIDEMREETIFGRFMLPTKFLSEVNFQGALAIWFLMSFFGTTISAGLYVGLDDPKTTIHFTTESEIKQKIDARFEELVKEPKN